MVKLDNILVSAFVTEGSQYELILASQLLPSLDKIGLKYNIEVMENRGSWLKNVAQKPLTILHTMEKFQSYNIISLDADCEVVNYPTLFTEIPDDCDIALHILDWDSWYGYTNHIKEVLSGTMWIRNTEKMRQFVKEWYLLSDTAEMWEQKCLSRLLEAKKEIKLYELPVSYCYIKTLPDGREPTVKCEPVIVHHQASRKYKKIK